MKTVLTFYGEIIYIRGSNINLGYFFNKIVNLNKILLKSNLYNSFVQIGLV